MEFLSRGAAMKGRRGKGDTKRRGRKPVGVKRSRTAAFQRASQSSQTIKKLRSELEESRQHQAATADVLKLISRSAFDLQAVLETLTESAANLCDADMAAIAREKDAAFYYATSYGFPDDYLEFVRSIPHPVDRRSMIGRTMSEGKPVQIRDVLSDPEYSYLESQKKGGFRTMLGAPLLREGTPIGVLLLGRKDVRPFTHSHIDLIGTFADQAVIAIETVRLLNDLQIRTDDLSESLEQQTATSDVLKVISSSTGDMKPVFETMLANALRICEAKFGHLLLYDGECFQGTHLHDVPPAYRAFWEQHGRIRANPNTAIGQLAHSKQVVHIPDLMDGVAYREREPLRVISVEQAGARSFVGVPMLKDDKLVGAIVIYRQEVRPFTEKQIELVQNFAAQAVIAIENTRLLNELRESLQQQTATADVLKVISSSPGNLEPVFQAILASATEICQTKFGTLNLFENNTYRSVALHNPPPQFKMRLGQTLYPHPDSGLARVARTKQVVHIEDIRTQKPYLEGNKAIIELADLAGARTQLSVPMLKEDVLLGSMSIYRQEVRPFTDKQIELVQNFAAQAVIATENARLLGELRESLQQQTATADVLKVISRSTFDLGTVLQTLVESASTLCDADRTVITRQKDGVFYRAETHGFSKEFIDHVRGVPITVARGSALGRALLERRAVHIPDVKADPAYAMHEMQKAGDYRTVLAVAMLREGIAMGVLSLARADVRPFTKRQIELATTFADQAAIAIENVRLFESVETRTRELAASLEDLRTTQDRLVQTQKLASLGQLTAGIAHEMKNPLNFVNNFSTVSSELIDELQDTLKSLTVDDKRRKEINELTGMLRSNLDKVVEHGTRADSIVKNMLLHSREGSGEHRVVDINALVEESLNLAYHGKRAETQGFNVTLERSLDPAAGEADVFPQDITRVLLNLISNGFYAASRRKAQDGDGFEPVLAAATKSLGDRVEIRIRDNGTGIPSDVREKIFNPFFTTKPAGEGTGLGLSISHDIVVKQHAGSIEVFTEPGAFTEIRVILPRKGAFLG